MRWIIALFVLTLAALPAAAQDQPRGSSFFCMALDEQARSYHHSPTYKTDPAVSTETYVAAFTKYLEEKGLSTNAGCTFTDLPENIPMFLDGLRQQCDDCAVFTLQQIDWKFEPQPAASTAGFKPKDNLLAGEAACADFTEANYRELGLSGGNDVQLKTMCAQAWEYFTMYKRAIAQGYSEADADRTYAAHRGAAQNAISFYKNNKAD